MFIKSGQCITIAKLLARRNFSSKNEMYSKIKDCRSAITQTQYSSCLMVNSSTSGGAVLTNQHHFIPLNGKIRSNWISCDQRAIINMKEYGTTNWLISHRGYCSKVKPDVDAPLKAELPKATTTTTTGPEQELSKKEKLKRAFKDYGATVVIFHVAISLCSLGGFYALVSGGMDIMPVLEYFGMASSALTNKIASGASTFVVAYAIHKVFAPVRISITLGATPFIVRYLRSKGLLKAKVIKQK